MGSPLEGQRSVARNQALAAAGHMTSARPVATQRFSQRPSRLMVRSLLVIDKSPKTPIKILTISGYHCYLNACGCQWRVEAQDARIEVDRGSKPGVVQLSRLSRAESQAQTRERLLDAAKRVFLKDGYIRASVDKVADEAGYSKGAIYSNFDGKEALFLELLKRKFKDNLENVRGVLERVEGMDALLKAVRSFYESNAEILEFSLVTVEFLTQVGRGSPYVGACAALYAEQREAMAELIGALFARSGVAPPVSPVELATTLIGLTMGLAVQRGIDEKSVSSSLWAGSMELCLRGLLALKPDAESAG